MISIIITTIYAGIGLTTSFYMAKSFLGGLSGTEYSWRSLDTEDYVVSSVLGLAAGAFWPITLPAAGFVQFVRKDHERTDPHLRQLRLDEREQRIRDLERELGIR